MKFLKEVTDNWAWNIPNHTYYLRDDKTKMVGYIPAGKTELVMFSKPLSFDARHRKFVEINTSLAEPDDVYFTKSTEFTPVKSVKTWNIDSSSGSNYTVTDTGKELLCTCKGFQFRRKCRHIDQVKEKELA